MFNDATKTKIMRLTYEEKAIRKVVIWYHLPLYCKKDLEDIFIVSPVDINPEEYYTLQEVFVVLGFVNASYLFWRIYRDANKISFIRKPFTVVQYYHRKQIDELKVMQIEYTQLYYSPSQVESKLGNLDKLTWHKITWIKADFLMKMAFGEPNMKVIYPKKEIDEFCEKWSTKQELSQIDYKGPLYDAFERRMLILGISYKENSETATKWFEYCYAKLQDTPPTITTRKCKVSTFVDCTDLLFRFIQDKELFALSSNAINIGLLSIYSRDKRKTLYAFCKELHDALTYENKRVSFNMKQLKKPYNEPPQNKRVKEIYKFDEYKAILDYATEFKEHKNKAIEDALNKIARKRTIHYASSWLYVLTSLNNAWRHPDIVYNLTALNLERLNIGSIEDLRDRDLTPDEAESVVRQIMSMDKSHTKTGAVARFFCSSQVAIPLATAAIICTLISSKLNLGGRNSSFRKYQQSVF